MPTHYVSDYEDLTGQKIPETPAEPGVIGSVQEPATKVVTAPDKAPKKSTPKAEVK